MNQEKLIFSLVGEESGMNVEIEGSAPDLINLLANAIDDNEDIKMVVSLALMAVQMKNKNEAGSEDGEEGFLSELMANIKPTAQA
jgi:hypothetical protein